MTPRLVVRPAAEAEISEAFQWYEDKSIGLGSEFMRAVDASLSAIQRFPTSYAVVYKEIRRAVLRRFPYSLYYLYENDIIVIIACFHGSRDPRHWQDRAEE